MYLLKWAFVAVILALLGWFGLAFTQAPIVPMAWLAPPNAGLTGRFAPNDALQAVATTAMPAAGPEDVACAADGWLYTGLVDGRIMRWKADKAPELFVNTGGRPLGIVVDARGDLLVADAQRGLLRVSPAGDIEVLTDSYRGRPMRFVDDLAVADDGTIWFSDASLRFGFEHTLLDFFEGSMTGRLMSYHPDNGETRVHMEGLFFANGVTLGPDDAYVLVNETGLGRIHRYWLSGPRAHTSEIFAEHLPGTPDNINYDGNGRFWVAMPSLRDGIDFFSDKPLLRRLLSVLPESVLASAANVASFIVALDDRGEVVANLQDPAMGYNYITSATPCGDTLWLGSLQMDKVAQLPLTPR